MNIREVEELLKELHTDLYIADPFIDQLTHQRIDEAIKWCQRYRLRQARRKLTFKRRRNESLEEAEQRELLR